MEANGEQLDPQATLAAHFQERKRVVVSGQILIAPKGEVLDLFTELVPIPLQQFYAAQLSDADTLVTYYTENARRQNDLNIWAAHCPEIPADVMLLNRLIPFPATLYADLYPQLIEYFASKESVHPPKPNALGSPRLENEVGFVASAFYLGVAASFVPEGLREGVFKTARTSALNNLTARQRKYITHNAVQGPIYAPTFRKIDYVANDLLGKSFDQYLLTLYNLLRGGPGAGLVPNDNMFNSDQNEPNRLRPSAVCLGHPLVQMHFEAIGMALRNNIEAVNNAIQTILQS